MCDAYECRSGVGGSSTALPLAVSFLARQRVFPRGAAWLSHGKMQC